MLNLGFEKSISKYVWCIAPILRTTLSCLVILLNCACQTNFIDISPKNQNKWQRLPDRHIAPCSIYLCVCVHCHHVSSPNYFYFPCCVASRTTNFPLEIALNIYGVLVLSLGYHLHVKVLLQHEIFTILISSAFRKYVNYLQKGI